MRKLLAAVIVVAVVAFGLIIRKPAPESASPGAVVATVPSPLAMPSFSVSAEVMTEKQMDRRSLDQPVSALAPTAEKIREEVEKNPHVPADSLISFAADLAPKMEAAMKSPEAAEKFFVELEDCLGSSRLRGSATVRALCLVNIRRLGQKVPSLKARADAAFEKADPELQRLAK